MLTSYDEQYHVITINPVFKYDMPYNGNILYDYLFPGSGSKFQGNAEEYRKLFMAYFDKFDDFLINKYSLVSEGSFADHYNQLSDNTVVEKIIKGCYLILNMIRNAAQHERDSIIISKKSYSFHYNYKGHDYGLEITWDALEYLCNAIFYIMKENVGSCNTKGHYEGVLIILYNKTCEGIIEMMNCDRMISLPSLPGNGLLYPVRVPDKNPEVICEDDSSISFLWNAYNGFGFKHIQYRDEASDYLYDGYLLPEELGTLHHSGHFQKSGFEEGNTITFTKNLVGDDRWKL